MSSYDLSKSNNNDKRNLSDLEWVEELYLYLQNKELRPEAGVIGKSGIKLTEKKAFHIIWFLQEHLRVLPDHIERCNTCGSLFDSWESGLYWETKGKHYCDSCSYLVPINYDKGKR